MKLDKTSKKCVDILKPEYENCYKIQKLLVYDNNAKMKLIYDNDTQMSDADFTRLITHSYQTRKTRKAQSL